MDTIYALSSGGVPSGVAVVRISGPGAEGILWSLCSRAPEPRRASYTMLRRPEDGSVLDSGLVLWLPGPHSFTGEDVAELQVHGGRAVLAALFDSLSKQPGTRPAEPGEFSRRAFANGRLDLAEVEGLADLIAAETEVQRRQAVSLAGGALSRQAEEWRNELISLRAEIEARLDFSDEGDVDELGLDFWESLEGLREDISRAIARSRSGERVRQGFRVALMGKPNAGKSTLLNALAQRDVAIVTAEPGTTRDVLEVPMDLGGYPVLLYDTAGLRETASEAEREGVRRAVRAGEAADLVLWLHDLGDNQPIEVPVLPAGTDVWEISTKSDLNSDRNSGELRISATTGEGLDALLRKLTEAAANAMGPGGELVARERHRVALLDVQRALKDAAEPGMAPEITADLLRAAADAMGRISGRVDVEDVLDAIFREFCIGK